MATLNERLAALEATMRKKLAERNQEADSLAALRSADEVDETAVTTARAAKDALDVELDVLAAERRELTEEIARDDAAAALQRAVTPTEVRTPAYDEVARVGQDKRTYNPGSDPKGVNFLRDVAQSVLPGVGVAASMRLARHMDEERVERAGGLQLERATTTSNFAGLVVPQYLTDLMAPHAKAGRPFADACRHHDLPDEGMTVEIGKITTGSSTAVQASQGDAVSETNMDDTLLSVSVQTNSGQQTVSRQAVERGRGIDATTIEDLGRSYGTTLDSTLLNQAATGLTNVATSIAYTDASPTAAELYPKLLAGNAAVEAALLDMDQGDAIAVMHSRRWYWLQSQLSSTWPLFGQPGIGAQQGGVNYGEKYGSGFRGILPNGTAVVVDNNIATNLGAGTNEDEIYVLAQSEAHLWEDPNAPVLIRAEEVKAANLQILLVVYGYFAYTHTRRANAQKIAGTGLVTPTF